MRPWRPRPESAVLDATTPRRVPSLTEGGAMARWTGIRKIGLVVALGALAACSSTAGAEAPTPHAAPSTQATPASITKIKHVVVLMHENRSYDSYFGHLHDEGQTASTIE